MVSDGRCSFQVLLDKSSEKRVLSEELKMNELLSKYGIHITFSPSRNQGRKGLTRYSIVISTNIDAVKRGAGRKPKTAALTMDEATKLEQDGVSKEAIAEMMGISIATYYRRRKLHLSSR